MNEADHSLARNVSIKLGTLLREITSLHVACHTTTDGQVRLGFCSPYDKGVYDDCPMPTLTTLQAYNFYQILQDAKMEKPAGKSFISPRKLKSALLQVTSGEARLTEAQILLRQITLGESDLDPEDMDVLRDRITNQHGKKAREIVKDTFGTNDPREKQHTDAIRTGTYRVPRAQRSIRSKSEEEFTTLLRKLDRDAYTSTITPQWAKEISVRMLKDAYTGLPKVGREKYLGQIQMGKLKNDPQGLAGEWADVYLQHDSRGYSIRLYQTHRREQNVSEFDDLNLGGGDPEGSSSPW